MSDNGKHMEGKEILDYFDTNYTNLPNKKQLKELIKASNKMEILTNPVSGKWETLHHKNNNPLNNKVYYDENIMKYYCVLNSKHDKDRQGILCFIYKTY